MKKLFVVLAASTLLLLSSCGPIRFAYTKYAVALDYSEYTNKGFYLTEANSVNFEYKAIGSITARVISGYVKKNVQRKSSNMKDDIYGERSKSFDVLGKYNSAKPQDALEELCNKAMEIGANGIINIKTVYIPDVMGGTINPYDSYVITGMAIRK